MGNISAHPEIGCLFIAFDRPFRLRLQGRAEVLKNGPLMGLFKEAELVVRVAVTDVWMNCPRYIHRYKKVQASRYVPRGDTETPLCEWKRIDAIQDVLRPREIAAVEKAGQITIDEWMSHVMTGVTRPERVARGRYACSEHKGQRRRSSIGRRCALIQELLRGSPDEHPRLTIPRTFDVRACRGMRRGRYNAL